MDLSYGPEYEMFREEVRGFIAANRHLAPTNADRAERPSKEGVAWQKLLIQHGYTARTIPREYGGFGAEPDIPQSRIIAAEVRTEEHKSEIQSQMRIPYHVLS